MKLDFSVSWHLEKRRNEGSERVATALKYPLRPCAFVLVALLKECL